MDALDAEYRHTVATGRAAWEAGMKRPDALAERRGPNPSPPSARRTTADPSAGRGWVDRRDVRCKPPPA